jgi:hypothetical protein
MDTKSRVAGRITVASDPHDDQDAIMRSVACDSSRSTLPL